ncbi:MAG: Cro/CI family transcriptional regulator [uncultured bacterium]|nr:MAG: Cro/CI family transcriptional regulator [uncultured bacterium]
MQVVAKTPRIELRLKGDIPTRIIKALESEYGKLEILTDEDEELVDITSSDWYKSVKVALTPGSVLRVYREKAGLTQTALGVKIGGVPRQHISGMETGTRSISKEMAKRLAAALNTSPLKFIGI